MLSGTGWVRVLRPGEQLRSDLPIGPMAPQTSQLGAKISGLSLSIKRKAGEEDKLFGSVTNQDIAEALAAQGIAVDRRSIVLADPIRAIGVYQVAVKVHRDVEASVKVFVSRA